VGARAEMATLFILRFRRCLLWLALAQLADREELEHLIFDILEPVVSSSRLSAARFRSSDSSARCFQGSSATVSR